VAVNSSVVGAIGLLVIAVNVVAGLRFRAGLTPVGSKQGVAVMVRWYRNPDLPIIWRMVPLVGPFAAAATIPVLILVTLGPLVAPHESPLPTRALSFLWLGSAATACFGVAAASMVSYRRPRWLVPRWLADDDRRVGHATRTPDAFDRLSLAVFFGLGMLLGVLALGAAAVLLLH
jgi:hypothetical protein